MYILNRNPAGTRYLIQLFKKMLVHLPYIYVSVKYLKFTDFDINSVFYPLMLVQITPVYFLIKSREIEEAYW